MLLTDGRLLCVLCSYQQRLSNAVHHLALNAGLTQDVVGGDAGLTAVGELAPCDAPGEHHTCLCGVCFSSVDKTRHNNARRLHKANTDKSTGTLTEVV